MQVFKTICWYRYNDNKDFYDVDIEAVDFISAEKMLKERDRRIYKVELI